MSDEIDVSDEPIVLKRAEETRNGIEVTYTSEYVPPLDGTFDDYAGFDLRIAEGVCMILEKVYFGYKWRVLCESRQGIVVFKIPALMGPTLWYVIKLGQYPDLNPELIVRCGGELLERMNLPRTAIDMAAYKLAEANKHRFDFGDVKQ